MLPFRCARACLVAAVLAIAACAHRPPPLSADRPLYATAPGETGRPLYVQANRLYDRDDLLLELERHEPSREDAASARTWRSAPWAVAFGAGAGFAIVSSLGPRSKASYFAVYGGFAAVGVSASLLVQREAGRRADAAIERHAGLLRLEPRDPGGGPPPPADPSRPLALDRGLTLQDDRIVGGEDLRRVLASRPGSREKTARAKRTADSGMLVTGEILGSSLIGGAVLALDGKKDGWKQGATVAGAGIVLAVGTALLMSWLHDRQLREAIVDFNASLGDPPADAGAGILLSPWLGSVAERSGRAAPVAGIAAQF
jgi:hypothetical protein